MYPRALMLAGTGLAAALALTGCGSSGKTDSTAAPVGVTATDTECTLAQSSVPAGRQTFNVANKGTKVTEFYVYAAGDRVVGEVENIAPGLTRTLVVDLSPGSYQAACKPGMVGDGIRTTLTVTGSAPPRAEDAKLTAAVASYRQYVQAEVAALVDQTAQFTAAVKAGDAAGAKTLYPQARTHYERIEPVAETFGDLDPRIDAREDSVEPGTTWTGFHRLEKDIWSGADLRADAAIADQLSADVGTLKQKLADLQLTPLELAGGAKELLDEVATSKVTGEEDRYSHTDLWDFQANLEGCKAVVTALRPVLDERAPGVGTGLDERFAAVHAELAKYRSGDRFVSYTELSPAQVKVLSDTLNGLAEPVSQVVAVVAK
jgi:iron uptake system component EfeO